MKIKTILKNDEDIYELETNALCESKKIIYDDNNTKVIIDFNSNLKIIRENNEYLIELEFENLKKTKGLYYFKDIKKELEVSIFTKDLYISCDKILLTYEVLTTEQSVVYSLEVLND